MSTKSKKKAQVLAYLLTEKIKMDDPRQSPFSLGTKVPGDSQQGEGDIGAGRTPAARVGHQGDDLLRGL